MEELGEAAKLFVYLKYIEFSVATIIISVFSYMYIKILNKILGDFEK